MAIKVCPNGHHYNTDDNTTCPYCERNNSGGGWSEYGASSAMSNYGGNSWGGSTEDDGGATAAFDGNSWDGSTKNDGGATSAFGGNSWGGSTENDINPGETQIAWDKDKYKQQPVVGWLVCIDGPDKGKDFVLHGAKCTIGRRKDSSVCLTDTKISRDGFPALVVYDDRKSHNFYLASGDAASHNNVELSGSMLLGQSLISPYDEIRIEDTVLVFVPFCRKDFFWSEG